MSDSTRTAILQSTGNPKKRYEGATAVKHRARSNLTPSAK